MDFSFPHPRTHSTQFVTQRSSSPTPSTASGDAATAPPTGGVWASCGPAVARVAHRVSTRRWTRPRSTWRQLEGQPSRTRRSGMIGEQTVCHRPTASIFVSSSSSSSSSNTSTRAPRRQITSLNQRAVHPSQVRHYHVRSAGTCPCDSHPVNVSMPCHARRPICRL